MENQTDDELKKEARKKYYREWRAKNKDKVAQHNRNFWMKKAAAIAASEQSGESSDENKN